MCLCLDSSNVALRCLVYLLAAVEDLHADFRALRPPGPNGEPLGQWPIRPRHHDVRSRGHLLAVHQHGLVPVVVPHQRLKQTETTHKKIGNTQDGY